jgi:hypothetical protein
MPYVLIGRYEKRRLAQPENNLKTSFIYNVQIKKRDVRSPRALYNLNFREGIYELRRKDKKDL